MSWLHKELSVRNLKDFVNAYWAYTRPECISFNIPVNKQ